MEERVYPCVSDWEFDSCKMGQIVRDVDKKGGFFSISEDLQSKDI